MFIHHVYFWLKNPDSTTDHQQLSEGIKTLLTIRPHILAHVGVPAGTARGVIDSSYSFSLLMIFDNAEDEASYQSHLTHDAFRDNYAHLWSKVVVYDSVDA